MLTKIFFHEIINMTIALTKKLAKKI